MFSTTLKQATIAFTTGMALSLGSLGLSTSAQAAPLHISLIPAVELAQNSDLIEVRGHGFRSHRGSYRGHYRSSRSFNRGHRSGFRGHGRSFNRGHFNQGHGHRSRSHRFSRHGGFNRGHSFRSNRYSRHGGYRYGGYRY